jgi:predicted metalloprotease
MRWTPGRRSPNLEDRRGFRGVGRLGLGGILILGVLSLIFGRDFLGILDTGSAPEYAEGAEMPPANTSPAEEKLVDFVSFVLDSAQSEWGRLLERQGTRYREAKLVLFRDAVQSACGFAQSVTGPFYCPGDEKIYIDLAFFEELSSRFGAPGDFAQAYVLAHEIGHHVQNVLGAQAMSGGTRSNELSVRLELQADCYAGIWAHQAALDELLEPGDVEEGLGAAAAVGDDRVSRGRAAPETFTHGSAAQRAQWFQRGLASGRVDDCDTFASSPSRRPARLVPRGTTLAGKMQAPVAKPLKQTPSPIPPRDLVKVREHKKTSRSSP